MADIDTLPFPAYDLIDLDLYQSQLSYAYNHRRQGVLLTSRGCVYHCTFCFSHWKGIRLRSAANIFEEIKELHDQHGIRDFYVVDDIFNVNLKRVPGAVRPDHGGGAQTAALLCQRPARRYRERRSLWTARIEAGAVWFTYAVESGTEEIQRLVKKHLDLEKAKRIITYTQHQNVAVNISTMYGFPTETREMAQRTLDWLSELPKPSLLPYHFCLRFFPGCEINQQAIGGRLGRRAPGTDQSLLLQRYGDGHADAFQARDERYSDGVSPALWDEQSRPRLTAAVRTLRCIGYSDMEITFICIPS